MRIRENKGVIGVDVGVAIIIFIMFVGVITMLFYNSSMNTIGTERKATATDIAVKVIEEIKIMDYNTFIANIDENGQLTNYSLNNIPEGYQLNIAVSEPQNPDYLREFIVTVSYLFKDKEEKVEIKTLKSYI